MSKNNYPENPCLHCSEETCLGTDCPALLATKSLGAIIIAPKESSKRSQSPLKTPPDIAAILHRIGFNSNSEERVCVGIEWDKRKNKIHIGIQRNFGKIENLFTNGKIKRKIKLVFQKGNLVKISSR